VLYRFQVKQSDSLHTIFSIDFLRPYFIFTFLASQRGFDGFAASFLKGGLKGYVKRYLVRYRSGPQYLNYRLFFQAEMSGPPYSIDGKEVERLFGRNYSIELLTSNDVLSDYPRFIEKGCTALKEETHLLVKKG
jgi:hypothetical protein